MAEPEFQDRQTLDTADALREVVPDISAFTRLAEGGSQGRVIPVRVELLADQVTPVLALSKLGGSEGSFLLESVEGGENWARYCFVGFDPELLLRGTRDGLSEKRRDGSERHIAGDPWEALKQVLGTFEPAPVEGLPRFWGGAVGYVPYDAVCRFEPTVRSEGAPADALEFSFAVGGMLLVFDRIRQTLSIVALVRVRPGDDVGEAYRDAVERIVHAQARLLEPMPLRPLQAPARDVRRELPSSSFSRADYESAVTRAKEYIRDGDIFQVVLSQRFRVPLGEVEPLDVYRAMRVINPSPYMFYLDFPECTILGASPETLVRVEDGRAMVRPIAGTRHRGKTPAEDKAIAEELLADPKERAEHVMLVDLGRNDLGRISKPGSVEITEEMAVERYSHVMHIVSNVEGELSEGRDAIDVLRATFPAGTLSGAPKVRAMQIIDELEPEPRGVYGGAVGYLGFDGNMDVAIAIRTAVVRGQELTLQAGAGIVEASDPALEYEETINKARAGLLAIETAKHRV